MRARGGRALLEGKMIEFKKEQLNYFKFTSFVNSELLKALRKTFKATWDEKFGPSEFWDDSESVRKSFLSKEGGAASTKVPTQISYEKWDCTALFQATIYARSFANSTGQTLNDLYLKPLSLPSEFSLICGEPTWRPGRNTCSSDRPTPTPQKFAGSPKQ